MSQQGKVVLITGASSGLGKSLAQHLHREGWRVYGTSRRAEGYSNPFGDYALLPMDVDDDASVAAGIQAVLAREGVIDAVICNAGMGLAGSIEDTTVEEALLQFQTNFFGVHRVCRAALPHLRARPRSSLIVIGSIAGVFGIPFQGFYSASKHALEGYSESLRIELRRTSVRVSIVEPGSFETNFSSGRKFIAAVSARTFYHDAFNRALAQMEEEERGGADIRLLCDAVEQLLEMDEPPLRITVGDEPEIGMATRKHEFAPGELEEILAVAYGIDPAE